MLAIFIGITAEISGMAAMRKTRILALFRGKNRSAGVPPDGHDGGATARPHAMTQSLKNEPGILYFGTPVVLITSENADGAANIAPMSSAFWLGWRGVLGLGAASKTAENIIRTRECVLNLPSDQMAPAVNRLALTTGANPVPEDKLRRGYRYEPAKFDRAGLSPASSETVSVPRIAECPVQMEAVVEAVHSLAANDPAQAGRRLIIEVHIQRVHLHDSILLNGDPDRVDPDAWRPLIMSFQHYYGLGPRLHPSALASIPEALYRGPDIDRARAIASVA